MNSETYEKISDTELEITVISSESKERLLKQKLELERKLAVVDAKIAVLEAENES
jgi:hypothetical protein